MKDILVILKSHPDPTPEWAVKGAVSLARQRGGAISGAMCLLGIPKVTNFLADRLVGASEIIAEENRKSRANAQSLITALEQEAGHDLAGPPIIFESSQVIEPSKLTEHARLFDVTIVPSYGHRDTQAVAEALIFGSGRPVLMLTQTARSQSAGSVIVAWDGSRPAARAVHDALPFLRDASSVQLLSVTGDKAPPGIATSEALAARLERHGISASLHFEPADGRDAGTVLLRYSEEAGADLLVMGAYGNSRIREFILGGATRTILTKSTVPVLLSH